VIVVVGSLNQDLVVPVERFPAPGETLLGGDYARHPGGKGANQAVAAARAGGRVAMVGRVGEDAFGHALLAALRADGVDVGDVRTTPERPTGVAFITVDAAAQNTIVVASGANAALTPEDLDPRSFRGAAVVVLQLEVPLDTVVAAARAGRAVGARVVLNLAPARALGPDALADVDVLVVNETEAALLTGLDAASVARDPEPALRALTDRVPAAVVTLGAAGAAWREGDDAGQVPGHRVAAIDTTAAGDAFVGALAVRLAAGAALAEAVAYANAAGALATTFAGAQPSLPTAAAIEALLAAADAPTRT
jgi:ribokinase